MSGVESECRFDVYDNASPGEHFSCGVRATHIPTGLVVQTEGFRSVITARSRAVQMITLALRPPDPNGWIDSVHDACGGAE